MFEKLIIRGFQKHLKLEISFDENITTLSGPSDRGKSAILRALRWLCLNRAPRNFIHWDREKASVTLFVDGHKIVRKKGKGVNCYILDEQEFKAFGRDVPEDISKILNVTEINFQRQHSSHFWISLPPPQVSKELNRIVDLGIIDRSLSNIASKLRKAVSIKELTEERLITAKEKNAELKWVKQCDKDLKELESLEKSILFQKDRATQLLHLVNQLESGRKLIQDGNVRLVGVEFSLKNATVLLNDIEALKQRAESIRSFILQYESQEKLVWQAQKRLQSNSEQLEKKLKKLSRCPVCLQTLLPSCVLTSTCLTNHQ